MMGLKGLFGKARASLQRRAKKLIRDYREQQRRKKEMMAKIREAQRQAYLEELERAATEEARRVARLKAREQARKMVERSAPLRERLAKIYAQTPKAADLLGYQPKKRKPKTPASIIMGTREDEE